MKASSAPEGQQARHQRQLVGALAFALFGLRREAFDDLFGLPDRRVGIGLARHIWQSYSYTNRYTNTSQSCNAACPGHRRAHGVLKSEGAMRELQPRSLLTIALFA